MPSRAAMATVESRTRLFRWHLSLFLRNFATFFSHFHLNSSLAVLEFVVVVVV